MCAGHWDYYASFCIWTRHFPGRVIACKLVPYDHPAPEVIERRILRP